MKRKPSRFFLGVLISLCLAFAATARGVESAPPPSPANPTDASAPPVAAEPVKAEAPPAAVEPAKAEAPPAATTDEAAAPAAPAEEAKEAEAAPAPPKDELRRLDEGAKEIAHEAGQNVAETVKKAVRGHNHSGNEMVSFGRDAHVAKDETVEEAVTIFGSTTIDGEVRGEAVSVFGKTTVNGSVESRVRHHERGRHGYRIIEVSERRVRKTFTRVKHSLSGDLNCLPTLVQHNRGPREIVVDDIA